MRVWMGLAFLLALGLLVGCASEGGGGEDDVVDMSSDTSGQDTTTMTDGVDPSGNRPPELDRIGNRQAGIGTELQIEVSASDPDGDSLTYSVFGALPEGSKFSKETRTFEWTPQPEDDGQLVILTFAVSDGVDEDRETIQITVTTSAESTRPVLEPIGDVFVEIGTPFELRLQATDEDGDDLVYSTGSPLPSGAKLDAKTGIMTWTPDASQEGSTFRVNFVVSDGEFTDDQDARFLVQAAELAIGELAPERVAIGDTLTFELPIENPLDFKYSCELAGTPPAGASFDTETCTLTYSPTDPALVGTSKEFVFRVTGSGNGTDYNLIDSLTVNIIAGGDPVECTEDDFEPNDTEADATTLAPGMYPDLSICGDEDWYAVDVSAGATITASMSFDHGPEGDLDMYLYAPTGEDPIAYGDSTTSDERVTFSETEAGTYYLRVLEFSGGQNTYDLTLAVEQGNSCSDDSHEPNDSASSAADLGGMATISTDGRVCATNEDWFSFTGEAGKELGVVLVFDNSEGDLDLELYDSGENLIGWSRKTVDEESIELASLPSDGTYFLRVYGYQGAEADYLLEITQTTGVMCSDDSHEPNDTPSSPAALSAGSQTLTGLTFCGDADFFTLPLATDETLDISMTWSGTGSAEMFLLDSSGAVTIATATPTGSGGLELSYPGDSTARDYLLEISNATLGLEYTLDIQVASPSCDALSCPVYEVCGDDGKCTLDYCSTDSQCPTDYRCRQTYCVDACQSNSDCRESLGYACRVVDPGDPLPFCSLTGSGTTGDSCATFAGCADPYACLRGPRFPNGSCAKIGCSSDADCDVDSTCVDVDGVPMCLAFCLEDSDCRTSDGYTCQALDSVGSTGTIEVCIQ